MLARIVVRTLAHEFAVTCPDDTVAAAMAFVRAAPEMPGRTLHATLIEVRREGAFHVTRTPAGSLLEGSPSHIVHGLHRYFFATFAQELAGAPVLHAASVMIGDARVILVAQKASGKTTLAVRLLAEGASVEGDEHVAVLGQSVVARPRTLRVKPGTIDLVPSLREAILCSPSIANWDGTPIYSVEPRLPGGSWRIVEGPAQALVFLEQNHGGRSVLAPLGRDEALRRAITMSYFPDEGKAVSAARLRMLVLGAPCYRLSLGDLGNAVWHLRRLT